MTCPVCGKDVTSIHESQVIHDDCWNEAERRIKAFREPNKPFVIKYLSETGGDIEYLDTG
jgi:hypothetical protein